MSPGYREAREQRRQEKLKAEEFEPVKGMCAVRKRVSAALIASFEEVERQYEQVSLFSQAHRNVLLLGWGVLRRTVRRRIKMLEKVPPMAFSISSPVCPLRPSLSLLPGKSLPLKR